MITAMFRNRYNADQAYDMLRSRGYSDSEINVLMSDKTRAEFGAKGNTKVEAGSMASEGMGIGGAIGTAVGATLAAVAAIGTSIAVPGLGLVVAGPIAAALAGGGAGAVTGGLIGGLVGLGMSESNAAAYQEVLQNGGIVIGVTPRDNENTSELQNRLRELGGENVCYC